MKANRSVHRTQWAAQFAVASELCKRGYEVALTLGNHPHVDIMVRSPGGTSFDVDVKGQYTKSFWVVKPKPLRESLFYILAFVPDGKPNQFFVLSQAQMTDEIDRFRDDSRKRRTGNGLSIDKIGLMPGIAWPTGQKFQDWDVLPK